MLHFTSFDFKTLKDTVQADKLRHLKKYTVELFFAFYEFCKLWLHS